MSKTEISGQQVKDGTVELVDLSPSLAGDITTLKSNVATLQTDVAGKVSASSLATVATSGSYNDLTNKPTIPSLTTVESNISSLDSRVTAVESDIADLQATSSAPNLSDLGEVSITSPSSGQVLKYNGIGWANASDSTFSGDYNDLTNKPSLFSGAYGDLTGKPSLATVATSGSYADLTNKPSLFSGAYGDLTGKPTLATVATTGSYTDLADKPSIPSISGLATETYVDTKVADLVASAPATLNTLNELAAALGNDASFSTSVTNLIAAKANSADLATVATSGSYTDLTNKPSIPSLTGYATEAYVTSAVSGKANTSSLATVATSGSYTDLTNKPSIPSSVDDLSDVTITTPSSGQVLKYNGSVWANAADSTFSGDYNDLTNKPQLFSGSYSDLTGKPSLATVATSGSYADLTNKPTLASFTTLTSPASGQFLKYNGTAWVNSAVAYSDVTGTPSLATVATTGAYGDLTGKPSLATVATSGSYSDLSNKPTLASFATLTSPSNGQVLQYNGIAWVNATPSAGGITSLNSQTGATQTFAVGTSGTDFAVSSSADTHTFNLPSASATARGVVTTGSQTFAGAKTFSSDITVNGVKLGRGNNSATSSNTCVGNNVLTNVSSGTSNTAVGLNSMQNLSTGNWNTAAGVNSMYFSNVASACSYFGVEAGYNTSGGNNTGVGFQALYAVQGASGNTAIGSQAGRYITGSYNTFVGTNCDATSGGNFYDYCLGIGYAAICNGANSIAIGRSASAAANCFDLRFGNAQRMVGDANGQFGINEASPGAQLQITSGSASRKALVVKAAASATVNIVEVQNSSGTALMSVDSTGRVGIGRTPSGDSGLNINITSSFLVRSQSTGTTNTSHYAFGNGNGDVGFINTTGSGTTYQTTSDYRLKENVATLRDALERVSLLNPCRFNFKADPSVIVDGFIAHELQDVIPESVSGTKDEVKDDGTIKPQAVDYSRLTPLLTAAIQELAAKNVALESKLTEFESRLAALENR